MITITPIPPEAEEFGMLIPLSATRIHGEWSIHAIPEAEECAAWLLSQSPIAITPDLLKGIDERLGPLVRRMGYLPEEGYTTQHGIILQACPGDPLKLSCIRPDTCRYHRSPSHRFSTETSLDAQSDACTIFATVVDDTVLSFANLNSDDGEVCDIGVETAPDACGIGLGRSNVAALTQHLTAQGRRVLYVALSDNPASVRLAKAVGFTEIGIEYNYVCFKDEAETETAVDLQEGTPHGI